MADEKVMDGWMVGGKFYCDRNCSGGGIPFGFVPEGSKCESCGKIIGAADPAQSAPSADEFYKTYPHCIGYPKCDGDQGMEHSEVCALKGKGQVSMFAFAEAYAALRTAQLERERDEIDNECHSWRRVAERLERERIAAESELLTRAETAESALRQSENLLALYRAKRESDGGPGRAWRAK